MSPALDTFAQLAFGFAAVLLVMAMLQGIHAVRQAYRQRAARAALTDRSSAREAR